MGDIVTVSAHFGYHVEHKGLDGSIVKPANDTAQFVLEFETGATLQFYLTTTAHVLDTWMKLSISLYGEKGTVTADWDAEKEITSLTAQQSDSTEKIHELANMNFTEYFDTNAVGARLFVHCILDDKVATPNLNDGYQVQRIIDAVFESHETGCRVNMRDLFNN